MDKLQPILAKLKGVLDHLEKIILGIVLIFVAYTCITKLLAAKSTVKTTQDDAGRSITLRGQEFELDTTLKGNLDDLVAEASGSPTPLQLDGNNSMVFNPRKWKEIIVGTNTILMPDSVKEPLGVSALKVTQIHPINTVITPVARLALNRANVQYQFTNLDYYPMQFQYGLFPPTNVVLATFIPHKPMARKVTRRFTLSANRGPEALHCWFDNSQARAWVLQNRPDWIVHIVFKGVQPVPPPNAVNIPKAYVDNIHFNLDIIYRTPQGQVVTNEYPNQKSKSPIAITRAYQADFTFQTKFRIQQNLPVMKFTGHREGSHIMMDGEALQIFKITPNSVHLWSDLALGGNGKTYIKQLPVAPAPAIAGGDGAAAPNPKPPGGGP